MVRAVLAVQVLAQLCLLAEGVRILQAPSAARAAKAPLGGQLRHFWATKNGDQNHTGFSSHVAPSDLSSPTWTYRMPVANHNSPVIDSEGNVYVTHTQLGVIALDRQGRERWKFKPSGGRTGNPVLIGGDMFICSDDGVARALDLASGKQRWESKIAADCPSDSWVASGSGQTVVIPANVDRKGDGNCDLVALNTTDGSQLWRFAQCQRGLPKGYNTMPSIVDGSVVFQDMAGGVHRLSLANGALQWSQPASKQTMTTGGMVTGPNGLVYGTFNYEGYCDKAKGRLQALDLRTGAVKWQRNFSAGLNAGPAVGRLGPGGRLAVIAPVADNFLEFGIEASFFLATVRPHDAPAHRGTVMAIDAETGEDIWSYEVDSFRSWVYPQQAQGCLPDAFGNSAIGGDGTVYAAWSGGYAYAINDRNGDGVISPEEVSKVPTQSGMNAEAAIAPGLVVVPSCDALRGYVA